MIIILRHGKTEWNQAGKLQGAEGDSELLPESYEIADKIKQCIKHIKFDIFLVSPIQRARKTFEYISPKYKQVHFEETLKEISFGDCCGMELKNVDPELIKQRESNKWDTRWINGESYRDVYNRLDNIIKKLDSNKTIGILAHETVNKILIGKILNYPKEKIIKIKHPNSVIYKINNDVLYYKDVNDSKGEIIYGDKL